MQFSKLAVIFLYLGLHLVQVTSCLLEKPSTNNCIRQQILGKTWHLFCTENFCF